MGRPRNDHFKLLLTRDNYLCVALTPMLSHDIPNCPILRAGYGKPCQLFDVVGATDADKPARSRRGREWRSSSARTRTRWTRRAGFPSRLARKRVVEGKSRSVRVDLGCRRTIKQK